MKNKFIWLPVAFIAVAVVGVAVWFGNTQIQKGSFVKINYFDPSATQPTPEGQAQSQPSSQPTAQGPSTCGSEWAQVFAGLTMNSNGVISAITPNSLENLQKLLRQGCSLKVVTDTGSSAQPSTPGSGSNVNFSYPAVRSFECGEAYTYQGYFGCRSSTYYDSPMGAASNTPNYIYPDNLYLYFSGNNQITVLNPRSVPMGSTVWVYAKR